jgi:SagB-type dehydrogenase family enzyme
MTLLTLPESEPGPGLPLQQLLARRRSIRDYTAQPLTLAQAASLLWAAEGITAPPHLRTAPSAGALYPLQLSLVAGAVSGLDPGVYRHLPEQGAIELLAEGDRRRDLAAAALGQSWLAQAPLTLVFGARYARTTVKYHQRGFQYVHIEVGHASQNVLLMAAALNLGAAVVGAFDDEGVARVVGLHKQETPLYLLPVGHPA